MTSCKAVLSLAIVLLAVPLALAQGTYTTIDFPGATSTIAEGIDTAGDIVGFFFDANNFPHGFLLSGGVYTQLDATGTGQGTIAYGINDVGQIVGSTGSSLGMFIYDIQTQTYTTYAWGSNCTQVTATGINNAGLIVGWAIQLSPNRYVGFKLRGSTFKQVSIPNAPSTQLTSINDSGVVIALAGKSGHAIAYLGESSNFKQIVVPGVPSALATAINDSNVLAGNYLAPAHNSAFEWQRMGLFEPINEPQEHNTYANGIDIAGQVVGYYCGITITTCHGFLWTPPADAGKK